MRRWGAAGAGVGAGLVALMLAWCWMRQEEGRLHPGESYSGAKGWWRALAQGGCEPALDRAARLGDAGGLDREHREHNQRRALRLGAVAGADSVAVTVVCDAGTGGRF